MSLRRVRNGYPGLTLGYPGETTSVLQHSGALTKYFKIAGRETIFLQTVEHPELPRLLNNTADPLASQSLRTRPAQQACDPASSCTNCEQQQT